MYIFKNANYDFLRWRWHALVASLIVILAGAAVIATKGLALGVEFAGGTAIIAQFEQEPSTQQVRTALNEKFGGDVVVQTYGEASQRQVMVRVPHVGQEAGAELSATANVVTEALRQAGLGAVEIIGTEIVSPTVGRELTNRGTWATVLSLGGILLYLTFRYRLSFAVGAVVATVHDLLVVFAFLAFFQYDLTLNVIAAILTVAGYSGNDTIVVFDRVRENLRGARRGALKQVINQSVNQTLGRTVITAGITFLSVVALFLFGGEVLRGFAFTLMVGIIVGTYSTVFIAASIVTLWTGAGGARVSASAPNVAAAQQPTRSQQPTRKTKPARKARVS